MRTTLRMPMMKLMMKMTGSMAGGNLGPETRSSWHRHDGPMVRASTTRLLILCSPRSFFEKVVVD